MCTVSHKAAVYAGKRKIDLAMVAIAMDVKVEIVDQLCSAVYGRKSLRRRSAAPGEASSGSGATSSAVSFG